MTNRGQELLSQLKDLASITALIGKSEDVHFDCKEWPSSDGDSQKVLAKAACGLANAEGGVIVIGMRARSTRKDEPDLVESAVPVQDTASVKSRVLNVIGELVEPRIEGIQVIEISERIGSTAGFVLVYVPATEGPPCRSRKDWKFYQRIGSGTFPMEYFQLEERFGRRPAPKLELYLEIDKIGGFTHDPRTPARWFVFGLKNAGRGLAKFPTIRYKRTSGFNVNQYGIDGSFGFGLPQRPSEAE